MANTNNFTLLLKQQLLATMHFMNQFDLIFKWLWMAYSHMNLMRHRFVIVVPGDSAVAETSRESAVAALNITRTWCKHTEALVMNERHSATYSTAQLSQLIFGYLMSRHGLWSQGEIRNSIQPKWTSSLSEPRGWLAVLAQGLLLATCLHIALQMSLILQLKRAAVFWPTHQQK